jgi:NADH-quinone oxidoreductase subunit L
VYLVARSNLLYTHAPLALEIVGTVGCITALFAATIAVTQNDLKRLLAYSTISQLGYMFVGCGVGVFSAGIFHLITHAFFKSLLFLAAGSVMHALSGELDLRKMGGLRHKMKTTWLTFLVATLAISGVPLFSGFFSKDEILVGAYAGPFGKPWLYWLATLTAGLTAFYMFRALFLAFHGTSRVEPAVEQHMHESGRKMTVPLIVLAFFSVVAGYVSLPKALGGGEWFDHYLQPVFASSEALLNAIAVRPGPSHEGGLAVMAMSLAVAGAGILLAYLCYLKFPKLPEGLAAHYSGLYRVLVNKYYIDEFYNWLVVRPIKRGSERILWQAIDVAAIDELMVNGSAQLTTGAGSLLRRIQSGNLRSYAAWMLLGAVLWLGYALLR